VLHLTLPTAFGSPDTSTVDVQGAMADLLVSRSGVSLTRMLFLSTRTGGTFSGSRPERASACPAFAEAACCRRPPPGDRTCCRACSMRGVRQRSTARAVPGSWLIIRARDMGGAPHLACAGEVWRFLPPLGPPGGSKLPGQSGSKQPHSKLALAKLNGSGVARDLAGEGRAAGTLAPNVPEGPVGQGQQFGRG
jgi:hypothetical protein